MPLYVDGFLIPVPKKNIAAYRRLASAAGKVWRKLGALEFRECVGDDLDGKGALSFHKSAKTKPGETVVFSWIVYRSRAHRDKVNAAVMKDPRILAMIAEMSDKKKSPFDPRKMAHGGFKVIVDA
ncbi:MAG: DUF1428 domain-containing protein [Planctomycetota bacterium]|nr:DUF1428 domain-containing protein [Planctomycetota bacterium]